MLEGLNPPQREAVLFGEGPLLVIAGAGSGKTRVLTTRIAHLMAERGVAPHEILAFTFTNKAAREMQERVARSTGPLRERPWIGTFHATGVRILRRQAHRLGYSNQFTIYDADDSRALIKASLKDLRADPKQFTPRSVASAISRFKNSSTTPGEALTRSLTAHEEKVAELYGEYEKRLRSNEAMDFDDLIGRTVQLLEEHRDVQQEYSQRFRHVLVDEFQDTNPLQLILIRALSAVHGNLLAVGDDDQSIYSWRGATVENMLEFEGYFPGAQVLRLEQNYRSSSLILRAANEVIAHNRRRKGKTLWSERAGGDPIELWWAEDEEDEARMVRDRIGAALAEGDVRRSDCVVLYRTNAQSRALEDALRREGIPYQIVGGTRFYERREVRDLLAYLKVIVNPADTVALARVLNVPRRGIGKTTAERFFAALEATSRTGLELLLDLPGLTNACGNAPARRLHKLGRMLDEMRKLSHTVDAGKLLGQVVEATGYEDWLKTDDPATADDRRENVAEFVAAAHAFASESEGGGLADFLESVALLAEVDKLDAAGDSVTLMTMHNAKGLEFPHVFVAGCEEGLLPHASSMAEDDGVEEERRLFYVGLTRAEDRAYLFCAAHRRRFGSFESNAPSRFLDELPEDCTVEMAGGRPAAGEAPSAWAPFVKPSTPRQRSGPVRTRVQRPAPGGRAEDSPAATMATFGLDAFRKSQRRAKEELAGGFTPDEFSQVESRWSVGTPVEHELLGEGVVAAVEGSGDLLRLTIDFGDKGKKRVLARYAHLRRLDGGD